MSTLTAKLISSKGHALEAVIEIDGRRLHVIDLFGGSDLPTGTYVDVKLNPFIVEPGEWDEIFRLNPQRQLGFDRVSGSSYIALGQIVSVSPVVCDCGLLRIVDPFYTRDERCIGEYVGFRVDRLDATGP
jgi:hypothetical protein